MAIPVAGEHKAVSHVQEDYKGTDGLVDDPEEGARFEVSNGGYIVQYKLVNEF